MSYLMVYPSQHLLSYFLPLSRFKNLWKILFKSRGILSENHSRMITRMYSLINRNNDPIEIMYHRNSGCHYIQHWMEILHLIMIMKPIY